jgi:hypothetical protein
VAAVLAGQRLSQRRLGEDLLIDPDAVRVRPLRTAPPDTAVPQQHRVQPLLPGRLIIPGLMSS